MGQTYIFELLFLTWSLSQISKASDIAKAVCFKVFLHYHKRRSRLGFCDHYISAFSMSEMHSDRTTRSGTSTTLTSCSAAAGWKKKDEIIEWV